MSKLNKLDFENVLLRDANEILAAQKKAAIVHRSKNIGAAGAEVELAVRKMLRSKIANRYYVGHGHVVDSTLTTSSQLDVIIADNFGMPTLFRTENGTEYFPYEAVYAIGEVKSSYDKSKKQLHNFVEVLKKLKSELHREKTPVDYVEGLSSGEGVEITSESSNPNYTYKNPLFSFVFFADGSKFNPEDKDIKQLYCSTPVTYLPNIVCLLNKGVILNGEFLLRSKGYLSLGPPNVHPEFNKPGSVHNWAFVPFGVDEPSPGANLGFLMTVLSGHLRTCKLMHPDMLKYAGKLFTYGEGVVYKC